MAACAATQGIYLAEKWAIQQWVSLLICGVPLGLMALSRLLKLPGIWRVIGPTAHVLLAALTVDHLVRTQPSSAEYLLILLLVVGAALAVANLATRSSGSDPQRESSIEPTE